MTKNKKFGDFEITTYCDEVKEEYFKTIMHEITEGNECFVYSGYIYDITQLWEDETGYSYEISKYCKSDCLEVTPGEFVIDSPTLMFCGTVVAHVWRCKND